MTSEVHLAAELIHDALDAADASYHERERGIIDTTSDELAAALLAAGWRPPVPQGHKCSPPPASADDPGRRTPWVFVRRMIGRKMYGEWRQATGAMARDF